MSEFFERIVYAMLEAEADLEPMSARTVLIAALKAMREPDEEEGGRIESAGMFALPFDKILDGEPYKQGNSALLCWQAMIDQAIKEGGGPDR